MLVEMCCDRFAEDFRTIKLRPGLNTVRGSAGGDNALGKSTFLWIIDYAFGGDHYCTAGSDVKKNVKDHTIFFTFLFDDTYHYFYRNTNTPKMVFRCDKDGHLIEELSLDEYRKFLAVSYHPGAPMDEVEAHYFRIYGRDNTYEKLPLLSKPRETDEKAVDFLLRLFGKQAVLTALHAAEEELGIKASQWKVTKKQQKSFEKIEENEQTIFALRKRMDDLMGNSESTGMEYLGFNTKAYEQVVTMRKNMQALVKKSQQLKGKIDALRSGNQEFINETVRGDFMQLTEFFPDINIKAFSDIEGFHVRIREILKEETEEEIAVLEPMLQSCESEIQRLRTKIEAAGIATDISQRVLSQCVNISKRIDELEAENRELLHEKEMQGARVLAERRMEQLIADQQSAIEDIVSKLNKKMAVLNKAVTNGLENPPMLTISDAKEISFGTAGNTSEGTACKSMILFDLAILELTGVPVIVHDGNILHSISRDHFDKLLELYSKSAKQIFIATDRAENDILTKSTIIHLSEDKRLFGFSWGRKIV